MIKFADILTEILNTYETSGQDDDLKILGVMGAKFDMNTLKRLQW